MSSNVLRIATRQSQLALWQAEHVRSCLQTAHPELQVELIKMTTRGDKILDTPLAKIGGKGLFVKELETGLLEGTADIAVHSMKDVPVELPDGLHLQVILEREDPRDAFVSNRHESLESLPEKAVVGTSSLRRQSQLKRWRPDLEIRTLRGNVNTRLDKLDRNEYEAIILASAGLKRLGMESRIREYIATERILPAIGQGAIGIECRADDERVNGLIQVLHHEPTAVCVRAERAFNATLQGGCQVPIGGYAELNDDGLFMRGLVAEVDGGEVISGQQTGAPETAGHIGETLARDLLARGADRILQALYNKD